MTARRTGWQPLQRSVPHRNGVPVACEEEQWANDEYVVFLARIRLDEPASTLIHLSIRNQDRSARHDWRDFQRIKNQLAGPDWEAVEIYPAESRLVDAANQYHLWCSPLRLGVGFHRRLVLSQAGGDIAFPAARGSVQRDFEPVDLRYGGFTKIKEARAAAAADALEELSS